MLIHTNTHTECTHLSEQCSAVYQRLSHTAMMGHSYSASYSGLLFSFGWKKEGVIKDLN